VRLAQTRLRKEAREHSNSLRFTSDGEWADPDDPLARLIDDEAKRGMWQEISALSSGERTVVVMFYQDEMRVNDIARALGVTPGTVKTLLFRARRRLRLALEGARR
jgi:RNA polymerase sigma-70 factor (ECF subfamily)